MAQATFSLGEWRDFTRDLEKFARTDQQKIIKRAAEQVGLTLDDAVKKKLPPKVRRQSVAKYWTDKQRKWWWATMRAKADGTSNALPGWTAKWRTIKGRQVLVISGHYKRTGLLVRSLDFDVTQSASVTTVRYGTNVQYAKWVIDLDNQSKYHAGNWLTLQVEVQRQLPLLRDVFANEVLEQTKAALGG